MYYDPLRSAVPKVIGREEISKYLHDSLKIIWRTALAVMMPSSPANNAIRGFPETVHLIMRQFGSQE